MYWNFSSLANATGRWSGELWFNTCWRDHRNHRHHTCNETFLIWGAKTILRLEDTAVSEGYGESTTEADEVAVATSPHSSAHALINVDPIKSMLFIGCQDCEISYSNSTSHFNVWKDL